MAALPGRGRGYQLTHPLSILKSFLTKGRSWFNIIKPHYHMRLSSLKPLVAPHEATGSGLHFAI